MDDRTNDNDDVTPTPWFEAYADDVTPTDVSADADASPAGTLTIDGESPDADSPTPPAKRHTHGLLRHRGVQIAVGAVALVLATSATTGAVVHSLDGNSTPTVRSEVATVAKGTTSTTTTVKAALAKITPSVVIIKSTVTSSRNNGSFGGPGSFGNGQSQSTAAGTGIVVSSDGLVLTNAHVIDGGTNITVTLADGSKHSATIIGEDTKADLAVIKVAGVSGLTPATFAKSAAVEIGDGVIAVGNAEDLGDTPSVTEGIISAKNRSISDSSSSLSGLLQTDAAISPGNSGGPLVDTNGNVIGMNTAVERGTSSEPAANIGFAIPSDTITAALPGLESGQTNDSSGGSNTDSNRGFLGVSVSDADGGGAVIESVQASSPAANAGLEAGDVITAVDGTNVADASALVSALSSKTPNTTVAITYNHDGSSKKVNVKLAQATTTG
jgi:S1-C subfamily serine protease